MQNSKTVMETLFQEGKPAEHECIIAAAILSSEVAPEDKFKALFGEHTGDEKGLPMSISLGGVGSSILIGRIIGAAALSNPEEFKTLLAVLMGLHERKEIHKAGAFRRGCILGLLSAVIAIHLEVARLQQVEREKLETQFFKVLFALMWQQAENDGFVEEEQGLLSVRVAEFIGTSPVARSAAFRQFLKGISSSCESNKGFPSDCAHEVATEFQHKVVTKLKGKGAAGLATALEEADTFYA